MRNFADDGGCTTLNRIRDKAMAVKIIATHRDKESAGLNLP